MSFLAVVEAACWVLVVSNVALVFSLVGRRWIRQRYFERRNSLALRLEREWPGWLKSGQPPPSWMAEEVGRVLLVEKAVASIEQDGKLCSSIAAIYLEDTSYHRYRSWREVALMLAFSLLDYFPYRLLINLFRVRGMFDFFLGRKGWGALKRSGFSEPSPAGGKAG